jgi:pyruvate,orthophosphate dikinase
MSRDAVFRSWWNEKAIYYRKMERFRIRSARRPMCRRWCLATWARPRARAWALARDPGNGDKVFYGEFLINAQGEDVVAGIRTPSPIAELEHVMPAVYQQLFETTQKLEQQYRDMQDFEFTIEEGKLYMLQTRNGKRTGPAAVKLAVEMCEEGLISKEEAVLRVAPNQLDQLLHPVFDAATLKTLPC